MCDEILEVVKDHDKLLRVHRQRFENGEPDYDKELHILTFDVLYCFWGYDDARQEAIKEYEEAIAQQHIEELQDKLSEVTNKIEEKTAKIQKIDIIGSAVNHKKWAAGEVCDSNETSVTVEFESVGQKKFQYPGAFLAGFLQPEDPVLLETLKQNQVLEQENVLLKQEKEEIEKELNQAVRS